MVAELVLSEKTVARHLPDTFVKLDVGGPSHGPLGRNACSGRCGPAGAGPSVGAMDTLPVLAGTVSTIVFVGSVLPMLHKAFITRELSSYSLGNIALANVGNTVHSVYVFALPPGPIWVLHSFYVVSSALMLHWYLRSRAAARGDAERPVAVGVPR